MKHLLIVFFLLSVFSAEAQNANYERHWKKGVEKVRVMSYNILDGFGWGEKDHDREERLVSWVKKQDPEILGLQELCGFTEETLSALAKQWGHPYSAIVKKGGYPVGITSKKPILVKAKMVGEIGHGLLHVQTYGFDVLITHLNPHYAIKRNKEASLIVQYIKEQSLTNCILMGDMNSLSPMDADYLEINAIDLQKKYERTKSTNLLEGELDYSVISHFLSIPLIDVCRKFVSPEKRVSYPTPILKDVSKHYEIRKRTSQRLDYILVSPLIEKNVVDAFIFNDAETEYLSDHFPVGVDLFLEED